MDKVILNFREHKIRPNLINSGECTHVPSFHFHGDVVIGETSCLEKIVKAFVGH